MDKLAKMIISNLSDDLLKPEYLTKRNRKKVTGHCYIASEAYYHLSNKDLQVYRITHENSSHWYLQDGKKVIDLTADQFITSVPYENGVRCGFLTKQPSKRAAILISRMR